MSEDRSRILSLLAEGKITADEAERLLDALESRSEPKSTPVSEPAKPGQPPKYLFVKVLSTSGDNVDVRIPLNLVRAGLKLTSLIPPQAMDQINDSMREHGMSVDLNNLKKEDIEELIGNLHDMEINVDAKSGDNVRVYCG